MQRLQGTKANCSRTDTAAGQGKSSDVAPGLAAGGSCHDDQVTHWTIFSRARHYGRFAKADCLGRVMT